MFLVMDPLLILEVSATYQLCGGGGGIPRKERGGGFGENFLKYKSKLKSFKEILRHRNKCSYYRPILLLYENVGETLCG